MQRCKHLKLKGQRAKWNVVVEGKRCPIVQYLLGERRDPETPVHRSRELLDRKPVSIFTDIQWNMGVNSVKQHNTDVDGHYSRGKGWYARQRRVEWEGQWNKVGEKVKLAKMREQDKVTTHSPRLTFDSFHGPRFFPQPVRIGVWLSAFVGSSRAWPFQH